MVARGGRGGKRVFLHFRPDGEFELSPPSTDVISVINHFTAFSGNKMIFYGMLFKETIDSRFQN